MYYRQFEAWFRQHPLRMPIFLIVAGAAFTVWEVTSGYFLILTGAIGVVSAVVGIVLLPFGAATVIRRKRHPLVLTCPHCHTESRNAPEPFRIDRAGHVEYAYVTCSVCGTGFTVDRYTRLV